MEMRTAAILTALVIAARIAVAAGDTPQAGAGQSRVIHCDGYDVFAGVSNYVPVRMHEPDVECALPVLRKSALAGIDDSEWPDGGGKEESGTALNLSEPDYPAPEIERLRKIRFYLDQAELYSFMMAD